MLHATLTRRLIRTGTCALAAGALLMLAVGCQPQDTRRTDSGEQLDERARTAGADDWAERRARQRQNELGRTGEQTLDRMDRRMDQDVQRGMNRLLGDR